MMQFRLVEPSKFQVYVVSQNTITEYLRSGGTLPYLQYDKDKDEVELRINIFASIGGAAQSFVVDEWLEPILDVEAFMNEEPSIFLSALVEIFSGFSLHLSIHELVEISIIEMLALKEPHVRWFTDGMAEAITERLLKEFGEEKDLKSFAETRDLKSFEHLKADTMLRFWPAFNYTLEWQGNPLGSPVEFESSLRLARYAYAFREIDRLLERHGIETVSVVMARAESLDSHIGEQLIDVVSDVTGEDIAARFSEYQSFDNPVSALKHYEIAYKEAEQAGDFETAYINLSRYIELSLAGEYLPHLYIHAARLLNKMGHTDDATGIITKQIRVWTGSDQVVWVLRGGLVAGGVEKQDAKLGNMVWTGDVEGSPETAEKWYRDSAAKNTAEIQGALGHMYHNGVVVRQDYAEAFKWTRKAAEQGDAIAQFNLGVIYRDGDGVPRDYTEMMKWFRLAAAQGDTKAQFNLGVIYRDGDGVPRDYTEAVKWIRLAAGQGDAIAQYNLGVMYQHGQGVLQDDAGALKWYRLAAGKGNANAQSNLGLMHGGGQGVPQDYTEAVKWLRLATEQGYPTAQYNLGIMYVEGQGVPQDNAEAMKWFRLAAEQGNTNAQYALGLMYAQGVGVNADLIQAYAWCGVSVAGGVSKGVQCYREAEQRLSPDEREKARQLTVEFRQKYMGQ